ncbi:MAG: type III-B CRISPR module RAMP protein Cmr1 [Candidatus Omnitrophica bacterium]|nr:type III-B CRISPR module RAMP protein Cmr1 [Candidatus Omnitrophota bacterium]
MIGINYNFSIITPLIMAGADRNEVELREASLKGILRWWFRFYKGASLKLQELKEKEGEIWGSQELASRIKILIKKEKFAHKNHLAYLCMNDKGGKKINIKRKAFNEGQDFEVNFEILDPSDTNNVAKELRNTLFFLSNFGGLGARWRRGFGSVMVEGFKILGNDLEEIAQNLEQELNNFQDFRNEKNEQSFMNLSNTSIYLVSPKSKLWDTWVKAMDELRDNLYRELKKRLSISAIAIGKPRKVSPLIIQIKKTNGGYYGVILIWKNWNLYEKCVSEVKSLDFKIKEAKS